MEDAAELEIKSKKNKYRRDKPWDNENIDHWKVEVHFYCVPQTLN
jgi:ribosomal RNA assembly protein